VYPRQNISAQGRDIQAGQEVLAAETRLDPSKIGVLSDEDWAAYYLKPYLFVKRFSFVPGGRYPDFDCSVEAYTNTDMLELETLSPLQVVPTGSEIVHEERWELYENIELEFTEESVRAVVLPLVR